MRNPDLPKLLRAIEHTQKQDLGIIYFQAAIELEKLEKIYKLIDDTPIHNFSTHTGNIVALIIEILDEDHDN